MRATVRGHSGDGACMPAGKQTAAVPLHADWRRAPLPSHVVARAFASLCLAARRHRCASVKPHLRPVQRDRPVIETSRSLDPWRRPLLPVQHDSARPYAGEVVCQGVFEEGSTATQFGCDPIVRAFPHIFGLHVHATPIMSSCQLDSFGLSQASLQPVTLPPATSSVTPVIQEELSEARKRVASATSSGVPNRLSGISAAIRLCCSSDMNRRVRSTSTVCGARQLMRTPWLPASFATWRVSMITPALAST